MLSTSTWAWGSLGTMWFICMSVIHSLTRGFTSSPNRILLGSSRTSPNLIKGWKTTNWLLQGHGVMAFIVQSERESQVRYLKVRFLSKRFRFFNPNHVIISLSFWFLLMMYFNFLTTFCSSAIFADKSSGVHESGQVGFMPNPNSTWPSQVGKISTCSRLGCSFRSSGSGYIGFQVFRYR